MQVGKKNRSVGATMMNQDSSRSHSIFTITVEKLQQGDGKVSPILSYCDTLHTHWSLPWYTVIAVHAHVNDSWPVAERRLHSMAAIPFAQADKTVSNQLVKSLLPSRMRHRER